MFNKEKEKSLGFTIIEILVVFVIIMILAIYTVAGYSGAFSRSAMERSLESFIGDVNFARERSLSSFGYKENDEIFRHNYGIFVKEEEKEYIVFLDKADNKEYNSGEEQKIVELEKDIKISEISPTNESDELVIVFTEDRKVYFNGEEAEGSEKAEIILKIEGEDIGKRSIVINSRGFAEIGF